MVSNFTGKTDRLDASPERGSGGVCDFEIRHAEACLLSQEVPSEGLGRRAARYLVADLAHELRVQLNVLLALLEDLSLPRRQDARHVPQRRVPLDGEFSRYANEEGSDHTATDLGKVVPIRVMQVRYALT